MKNTICCIALLFFPFFNKTYACSCSEELLSLRKLVKSEYTTSDLIFAGEVIEKEDTNKSKRKSTMDIIVYTFKITKLFKGDLKTEFVKIRSYRDSASCGYNFKKGIKYLVYSDYMPVLDTQNLQTGTCKRNQIYENVIQKEIDILNKKSKVQ